VSRLGGVTALCSLVGAAIGGWFFVKEHDFASKYDNELAAQLQWVGVALVFLGVGGFLAGIAIGYRDDD